MKTIATKKELKPESEETLKESDSTIQTRFDFIDINRIRVMNNMANTRSIRRRIRGVQNTAKITRAMEMIASSKMRKAQERGLAGRPYSDKIKQVIADLAALPQADEEHSSSAAEAAGQKNCYCSYHSGSWFIRRSGCQLEP